MAVMNYLNQGAARYPAGRVAHRLMFEIPVTDGLVGAFFFGHGLEMATENWAPGGVDRAGVLVGTPVAGVGYVEFSGGNFLQTQEDETAAMTLIAVGKRKASNVTGAFIGNYLSSTAIGIGLYAQASGPQGNAGRVSGSGSVSASGALDQLGAYALTVPATGAMTLHSLTTGGGNASTATADRVVSTNGKLRVGWMYSTGFVGPMQMNSAFIFNRVLTVAERGLMHEFVKKYAALSGFAV